jgi:hypothetical protein
MIKKNSGFLIIEVLIALVILTTVTLSIYTLVRTTQIKTTRSDFSADMAILAQNGMEIASDNLRSDWDAVPEGSYYPVFDSDLNTWGLVPLADPQETGIEARYTRNIQVKNVCRSNATGEILEESLCSGTIDKTSKLIEVNVGYMNPNFGKPLSTDLLVIKEE